MLNPSTSVPSQSYDHLLCIVHAYFQWWHGGGVILSHALWFLYFQFLTKSNHRAYHDSMNKALIFVCFCAQRCVFLVCCCFQQCVLFFPILPLLFPPTVRWIRTKRASGSKNIFLTFPYISRVYELELSISGPTDWELRVFSFHKENQILGKPERNRTALNMLKIYFKWWKSMFCWAYYSLAFIEKNKFTSTKQAE